VEIAKARFAYGQNPQTPDLFESMMNAKDSKSGRQFGIKDLWIESILLLVAGPCHRFCFVHTCADRSSGSDTTAAAMCANFFHLAHYPTILKQVVDEVKAVFRHADDIAIGAKLDSCRYLQACVDEVMRLDPSTPNPLPRCTQSGGAWVDGELLPEGTNATDGVTQQMG
jgi:cytochrome P450